MFFACLEDYASGIYNIVELTHSTTGTMAFRLLTTVRSTSVAKLVRRLHVLFSLFSSHGGYELKK